MGKVYLYQGKFHETISLIDDIISQVKNFSEIDYYLEALNAKSRALYCIGELNKALNCISLKNQIKQSLVPSNMTDYHKKLLINLRVLEGEIYLAKNDHKKTHSICKECLSQSSQIDYKMGMVTIYNILGISYLRLGDFDKSLDYFQEAKSLCQQMNDEGRLAIVEHHIGFIYANKGQYHIALKQYEKTLDQVERLGNDFKKSIQYLHMGIAYHALGKLELAKKYFQMALNISKKLNRIDLQVQTLTGLFNICIRENNLQQAQEYFEQLLNINNLVNDKSIDQKLRLFNAVELIKKPEEENIAKAEELLRSIINEETTYLNYKILAIEKLASVLLKEYQITGSKELFDELNSLSSNLLGIAKTQKKPFMRFSALIIKIYTLWIHAMFNKKKDEIEEIQLLIKSIKELALVLGYDNLTESITKSQKSLDFELKNNEIFLKKYIEGN
ncbi:MAG: tetratricopeptide repeat protein [Asgard group archaeon]|nr:tetratricopeptide repeat protein [Asgard group archaeon]